MARYKVKSPDSVIHDKVRDLIAERMPNALENRKRRYFAVEDPDAALKSEITRLGAKLVEDEVYDLDLDGTNEPAD